MESKLVYCKKRDCDVMDCSRNPKNVEDFGALMQFAHLEENPLYCKKANWNRCKVTPEQAGNSSDSELLEVENDQD